MALYTIMQVWYCTRFWNGSQFNSLNIHCNGVIISALSNIVVTRKLVAMLIDCLRVHIVWFYVVVTRKLVAVLVYCLCVQIVWFYVVVTRKLVAVLVDCLCVHILWFYVVVTRKLVAVLVDCLRVHIVWFYVLLLFTLVPEEVCSSLKILCSQFPYSLAITV